jgi:HSP20 family protein
MLVRYNPWQEFSSLQRQIDRLFEDSKPMTKSFERSFVRVPAAELQETNDNINLKLELPGIAVKDLDIQVTKNAVYIRGDRKSETKTDEKGMIRSEFRYGKFERVIPLSVEVDNTNALADYKDGILNLTLPKSHAEKNRIVKVTIAENQDSLDDTQTKELKTSADDSQTKELESSVW